MMSVIALDAHGGASNVCLSRDPPLRSAFVQLDCDEETQEFLDVLRFTVFKAGWSHSFTGH